MKTIAVLIAAASLAACTSKHTTIEQPAAAPAPVVVAPAPGTVVLQPSNPTPSSVSYTVIGDQ